MTMTPETGLSEPFGRRSRVGHVSFVVLFILQFCFSALLALSVLLFQFAFDGCGERSCNYGLGEVSMWTGWIGIVVALAATIVLGRVLDRRSRVTWWIPVAGSSVAFAITVLSYCLTLHATGLTHI